MHEAAAPAGYSTAPDQTVTVTAGQNTVVVVQRGRGGSRRPVHALDRARPTQRRALPLAGAIFDLAYDPTNDGDLPTTVGFCTTLATGSCSPPGNDGAAQLLPGRYQVTETAAPPGYGVHPADHPGDRPAGRRERGP